MFQLTKILALCGVAIGLTLTGCSKESDSSSTDKPVAHTSDDGDDHDDDVKHDDEMMSKTATPTPEPVDDHVEPDMSDSLAADSVTFGDVTFKMTLTGSATPNSTIRVDIVQTAGPKPATVRLWIGDESGVGSLKSKIGGHGNHFHGSAEVPSEITPDSALWIEIESSSGERTVRSHPLP